MKGIFFSQIKMHLLSQGAVLKVLDEIKAFETAGFEIRHVNIEPLSSGLRSSHIGRGVSSNLPFTCVFSNYKYESSFDGYDFYYFRFEAADRPLMRLLRRLRENNPDSKIIIELPNFPHPAWMVLPWCFGILMKDILARRYYKNYVDRFVTLDPTYHEIYGVPVLNYMNGIDLSRFSKVNPKKKIDKKRIDIVGVATMFPTHGYDRLIRSLDYYYKHGGKRNILFHIVGEGPGPELKKYKDLVNRFDLRDHVIFEGSLLGDQLAECYSKCDIALDDLCGFRMGLSVSSSLKSREYMAQGLPIIAGCYIDILIDKDYKYLLQLENDDTLIDVDQIVEFYDGIYSVESRESVITNIRMFAQKYCSYGATLQGVFDYIRKEG